MARDTFKTRLNFSDRTAFRQFVDGLGAYEGEYIVTGKPVKPIRSNNANAYYHAVTVEAFRMALKDRNRQHFTHDQCHEYLRDRFIEGELITNPEGEEIGRMPASSAVLNTSEFYNFVETCNEWIYDTFGWPVEEPGRYGVTRPEPTKEGCER